MTSKRGAPKSVPPFDGGQPASRKKTAGKEQANGAESAESTPQDEDRLAAAKREMARRAALGITAARRKARERGPFLTAPPADNAQPPETPTPSTQPSGAEPELDQALAPSQTHVRPTQTSRNDQVPESVLVARAVGREPVPRSTAEPQPAPSPRPDVLTTLVSGDQKARPRIRPSAPPKPASLPGPKSKPRPSAPPTAAKLPGPTSRPRPSMPQPGSPRDQPPSPEPAARAPAESPSRAEPASSAEDPLDALWSGRGTAVKPPSAQSTRATPGWDRSPAPSTPSTTSWDPFASRATSPMSREEKEALDRMASVWSSLPPVDDEAASRRPPDSEPELSWSQPPPAKDPFSSKAPVRDGPDLFSAHARSAAGAESSSAPLSPKVPSSWGWDEQARPARGDEAADSFEQAALAYRKGDYELARLHLEHALTLEPANRIFQTNLKRVLKRLRKR